MSSGHPDDLPPGAVFAYYDRLARVSAYVDRHLAQPILLGDAARVAGLERKYFSRFFRDKVGICFRDWLNRYRIHKAIELLRAQDETISRVAIEVGYQDLRTFQRAFRRCMRSSPSAFRDAMRKTLR